jgi:hypothetical protein
LIETPQKVLPQWLFFVNLMQKSTNELKGAIVKEAFSRKKPII